MNLTVINKNLVTDDLVNSLTEGEKSTTTIKVVLPCVIDGKDIKDFNFKFMGCVDETLCETILTKTISSDEITLSTYLPEEFTYLSGEMDCQLVGENQNTTELIKFIGTKPIVIQKKLDGLSPIEKNEINYTNVGDIKLTACENAPCGWALCNGQVLSREDFKKLFDAIGTTYGEGDGESTFNLPSLCGKVAVGKSDDTEFSALGKTGGEKTHSLTANENGPHTHSVSAFSEIDGCYLSADSFDYACSSSSISSSQSGLGTPHNNLQPYLTLNYIIFTGVKND